MELDDSIYTYLAIIATLTKAEKENILSYIEQFKDVAEFTREGDVYYNKELGDFPFILLQDSNYIVLKSSYPLMDAHITPDIDDNDHYLPITESSITVENALRKQGYNFVMLGALNNDESDWDEWRLYINGNDYQITDLISKDTINQKVFDSGEYDGEDYYDVDQEIEWNKLTLEEKKRYLLENADDLSSTFWEDRREIMEPLIIEFLENQAKEIIPKSTKTKKATLKFMAETDPIKAKKLLTLQYEMICKDLKNTHKLAELRGMASAMNIKNYGKKNKEDLCAEIGAQMLIYNKGLGALGSLN